MNPRGWRAINDTYIRLAFVIGMAVILLAVQGLLPLQTVSAASGQTFYVAPDGDDSNTGTLTSPWQTIQKAANTLAAGDTVLVREGIYKEFVIIKTSGSKTNGYITYKAYPGENPVIDGSELAISSGRSSLIDIRNASYIVVDGFELRNLKAAVSSQSPAGIRVTQGGNEIHLVNNNVHHIENSFGGGNGHGIHILGSSSVPLTNIRVSGNEVHHLATGSSESVTLSGNIDGFVVENNKVHDNNNIGIDIAGFYGACMSPCTDQARNGTVAGNTVYNIDSSINPSYKGGNSAAGIYSDGAANVVIERNRVFGNDFGIEVASEKRGKQTNGITVKNNFIYRNDQAGIILGGAGTSNGGAADIRILNNTIAENDVLNKGYGAIAFQYNVQNVTITNNIMSNHAKKMFVQKYNTSGSDITVDYNLYYRPDGENSTPWTWNGTPFRSWNDLKAATGFDEHSIFADPKLVDLSDLDLSLLGGSSAPVFKMDGSPSEWGSIPLLISGGSNPKSLKVANDQDDVYILLEGNMLNAKTQFYIDADGNSATGYKPSTWAKGGAEYLLENGTLYKYTGENNDWSWKKLSSLKTSGRYLLNDSFVEVAIPMKELGVMDGDAIGIGVILNDSKSTMLPAAGGTVIQELHDVSLIDYTRDYTK